MADTPTPTLALRSPALIAPIACGCCLAAGAAYVAISNPSENAGFIPCPFRSLTGLWCPGCGLTRATHYLFRGDLTQALRYNLFVVAVLLGLVAAWGLWLYQRARDTRVTVIPKRLRPWVVGVAVTVMMAFAVVRNLPGVEGLRG